MGKSHKTHMCNKGGDSTPFLSRVAFLMRCSSELGSCEETLMGAGWGGRE